MLYYIYSHDQGYVGLSTTDNHKIQLMTSSLGNVLVVKLANYNVFY